MMRFSSILLCSSFLAGFTSHRSNIVGMAYIVLARSFKEPAAGA